MADESSDQNAGFIFGTPARNQADKAVPKPVAADQPSSLTQDNAAPSDDQGFIYGKPQLQSSSTWGDITKGAVSGLYEGATRLPEALPHIPSMLSDEATYLMYKGLEKAGKIPSANEAFADYKLGKEQVQSELESSWFGKPAKELGEKIGKGVEAVKEKLPDVTQYLPYYGYEPKGKPAAIAKEGMAGGIESAAYLPFGPYGAFGRFVSGAVSGGAGELARQKYAGTEWETTAQFLGAAAGQLLGDMGIGTLKAAGAGYKGALPEKVMGLTFIDTEKEIAKRLNSAIESDIKNDLFRVSPQEISDKIKNGEISGIGDLVKPGSQTAELLMDIAAKVPGKRPDNIIAKTLSDFAEGEKLDYGIIKKGFDDAAKLEADSVFQIARDAPNANNITLKDIGRLADDKTIQGIMKGVAEKETLSTDPKIAVKAPEVIPGTPGAESKFVQTERGFVQVPEVAAIPEKQIGGNINFWHEVKMELGNKYKETGDPKYLSAQKDLIKAIRAKVPEYGEALDKSAAKYAETKFVESGYDFMKRIGKEELDKSLEGFKQLSDEQKNLVRTGMLANLMEVAGEASGSSALFTQVLSPQSKLNQKLIGMFDKADYDKVVGSIIQQNIENRVAKASDNLAKRVLTSSEVKYGVGAGAGGGAIGALAGFLAGGSMMTPAGALAAVGAVLGSTRELALNSLEKKIAPTALEMLRSPEGAAKLANLIQNRPEARSFFQKMNAGLMRAAIAGERSKELSEPAEPPPLESYGMPSPNANGGRIAYKSGGRVKNARAVAMSLLREIDQTRKMIGKRTEDILSMPDDAVATALTIARGNV